MELDRLILNDISDINALILKIEEKVEGLEIRWSYKDRVLSFGKIVNGKYYEKERRQFGKLYDIKGYLEGVLKGLSFRF